MSDERSKEGHEEINEVLASIRRLVSDKSQQASPSPLKLTPEHAVGDKGEQADDKSGPLMLSALHLDPKQTVADDAAESEVVKLDFADEKPDVPVSLRLVEMPPEASDAADEAGIFDKTAETPAADEPLPEDATSGFFDEELLRAMVADIVREELNGQLGDRITRNVRKMVRREVLRAMDFDKDEDGGIND